MRLTEEELHTVWDFGQDTLGLPGNDINPKWLMSMVEEIRASRTTPKSVGTRLIEMDEDTRRDLVEIVGCAINALDADEFSECLATIAEMIFPELIGEIVLRKKEIQTDD